MSNKMNLPWVSRFIDDDYDGYKEIAATNGVIIGIFPTHIADYIVKCVNEHEVLVDALQNTLQTSSW